jgi:hypothetical protein
MNLILIWYGLIALIHLHGYVVLQCDGRSYHTLLCHIAFDRFLTNNIDNTLA